MRRFEAAANRRRGRPGRLRRLLLARPLRGGPAKVVRVLYWLALLAFNATLAWWVSMIVSGPPAFLGTDAASRSEEVDAVLGLSGCFLLLAVFLWAWTVFPDRAEPEEGYRPRIDPAAWAAREDERAGAAKAKAAEGPGGAPH